MAMKPIYSLLDGSRAFVRQGMKRVARMLDRVSNGRINANAVTITALVMHLPIAWLIADGAFVTAAILLVIFGLFDTLDGEIARLQNTTSPKGMFLDSTTDRIKEVLIYCGIVGFFSGHASTLAVVAAVGALGASFVTSYINAAGEVALAASPKKASHEVNKSLRTGLLGFEVRMFLLVVGLLLNQLEIAVYIILVFATITVLQRITNTLNKLQHVQN